MKIYCVNKECKKRSEGYAICTALMDVTECPKRKEKEKLELDREADLSNE